MERETKTWRTAAAELWRAAFRQKLITGLIAVVVLGSMAGIAVAGTRGSGGTADSGSWAIRPAGSPAAPVFSLPLLGHTGRVSLAAYAGRPVIVNFFASWCEPCATETPMLARFYRDHHGSVALVGIDGNDVTSNALPFTKASGVSYPVGWDPKVSVGLSYQVTGVPQTFFLDARHRVVYRVFGAVTAAQLSEGVALAELAV